MTRNQTANDKFYTSLSQLGAYFIDPDGGNKKIRSLNSAFGVFVEECSYRGKHFLLDCTLMSFSGCQKIILDKHDYVDTPDYLHQHDYFEMMIVLDGIVNVRIETGLHQYQSGDVCLVNRAVKHLELFDQDCSIAFLCISEELAHTLVMEVAEVQNCKELVAFFNNNLEKGSGYQKKFLEFRKKVNEDTSSVKTSSELFIKQMMQELSEHYPGYTYMVHGLLVRLLSHLASSEEYQFHIYHLDSKLYDHIFEQVCAYISRTDGRITRKDIEQELHYSADYLNKIVKRQGGMTLIELVQSYRMREAASRIRNSDTSIAKIIQDLGFENKTYFYRLFEKTYRMTPMLYRKSKKKTM
ncbi:AraC family transcriptional regulator [Paenibacillus sanguinis]|uniref:AraC family transcriptional regulator n=1 Tax=Paenibacillus sanguinis TaxID=225906 RepID=UPI0003617676|nr:AraC family transcriptional regulator [Paenibacillus sanguinis]